MDSRRSGTTLGAQVRGQRSGNNVTVHFNNQQRGAQSADSTSAERILGNLTTLLPTLADWPIRTLSDPSEPHSHLSNHPSELVKPIRT